MDLEQAKQILCTTPVTCVLCKDDQVVVSDRRGVAPLMGFWEDGLDLRGYSAADKVVGKATALLYCLLDVRSVYAQVMSRPALQVLQAHRIEASFDQLVDAIQNRTGDGFCPMETATRNIFDPKDAPAAIKQALENLNR